MISTLCKRYKDASSLTGREKLENVRVSGLIGRRIFFFCLACGLTGRQKKNLATSAAKGRCVFSLKITLSGIHGRAKLTYATYNRQHFQKSIEIRLLHQVKVVGIECFLRHSIPGDTLHHEVFQPRLLLRDWGLARTPALFAAPAREIGRAHV